MAAVRRVDDVGRGRGDVAEGGDMGHHVMPLPPLVLGRLREVDGIDLALEHGDLRFTDARLAVIAQDAEFVLRLGERDPQAPPGAELALRAPQLGHGPARIASHQRVVVNQMLAHQQFRRSS